jgi:predicted glycosyltransferase
MKILIDIGHPGQVHLWRPFTNIMEKKGHSVLFTCRDKEFEIELLTAAGFNFICLGKHYKKRIGKLFGLLKFNIKLLMISLSFKPDIFLSAGSIYASQVAWLLGKPHISMEDTGNMEQVRLYLPFTSCVLTPDVLPVDLGPKQLRYAGYHELAYLHPKYFSSDEDIASLLSLKRGENYFVLRFVAWNATHDKGQNGLSEDVKKKLVFELEKHGKVFISAEGPLDETLEKYRVKISPEKLHDVLSKAEMVVSEGATIASEAGIFGVNTIYVNTLEACNNYDQEKYGCVFNFRSEEGVFEKAKELLQTKSSKKEVITRMLADKIDVTAFLVWFIENYPKSETLMKKEPEFQVKFK